MGNRQGQRTDIKKPELRQNIVEVPTEKGKRTDEIAAEAVGWNRENYRQAKTVAKSSDAEVIRQMDSGNVFISAVYERSVYGG